MSSLADLVINIEADSSGLETQLKKGMDTIMSFVDKANSQSLDWQSILAGSLDTAIIAGIASTFALAIEQTVNFQSAALNLNNIATPATASLANSINQIGGQAYQLAQSSGQSLGDATAAFEAFSKAGLDSAAATTAVNEASQIAYATGESYTNVVSELVTLFQNWGVTTTPQVTEALTGLANAAQNGKFTFDELISAMTPQGAILATKTNISDVSLQLAELSTKSGLTKDSILSSFNTITTAASQGLANPINNLVGNMSTTLTGPDGLIGAFQKVGAFINQGGPAMAGIWGNALGLMSGDTASFENTSTASFQATATATDILRTHLKSLSDITDANTTEAGKLKMSWNDFMTTISQFIVPESMKALSALLDTMTASVQLISGFFAKAPSVIGNLTAAGIAPSQSGGVANSTPSGGLPVNLLGGSQLQNSSANGDSLSLLGNSIGSAILNFLKTTSPNTYGPSQNSTNVNLNTTLNVSGAGGNPAAVGQNIGTQLFNHYNGSI